MRNTRRGPLTAALAALAALAGCSTPPDAPAAAPRPLRVDGNGILAGASQDGVLTPDDLRSRVSSLLSARRFASAEILVRRYPDVALLALLQGAETRQPPLQFIADVHDRQCASTTPSDGWSALLHDRIESPERYRGYDHDRESVLRHLREGEFEAACRDADFDPPSQSPGARILQIEAARLRGVSFLLADHPRGAVAAFDRAAEFAALTRPWERAHLLILGSEAAHRAGDTAGSAERWTAAVTLASGIPADGLIDPAFWERALNLRPADAPWPAEAIERLSRVAAVWFGDAADGGFPVEPALWAALGRLRLDRGEDREALLAFSRAMALSGDSPARDRLRVDQAVTLIRLGQPAAAGSLLAALSASADPLASRPALATWGALELKLGNTARGLALLESSVGGKDAPDWPDRGQAEANLGLALLLEGQEEEGLRRLRAAQARFQANLETEQWIQSLKNELRWCEQARREQDAESIRERLELLEGSGGR